MTTGRRRWRVQVVLAAVAVAGLLALVPGTVFSASCGDVPSTATAGRPLTLSGPFADIGTVVDVSARNDEGALRQADVVMANSTWRSSLLFRAADAGSWTLHRVVDGVDCATALTVVLPDGVTAPPHETPTPEELSITRPPAITQDGIRTVAATAAIAAVWGSWLFLGVLAVGRGLGHRPLARSALRGPARVAAFIGTLGGFLTAYLFVWFLVSMSHFDSGIPPDQQAILWIGLGAVVLIGCVLGAVAARRTVPALAPRSP